MNLENRIEVGSVSEFLEAVKQIYCDKDHQLFYRGVSQTKYATPEYDHPGIYRNKNWIENEDKMFYELTAKCPEYFKDCKTTFEHLVMMQHYDYPTRLLDITSNPLVSLYFACGGKNGANSENNGQLISYHIKKNDIRNYESDRVHLLSTISLIKKELLYFYFFANYLKERYQDVKGSIDSSKGTGIQVFAAKYAIYEEVLNNFELVKDFNTLINHGELDIAFSAECIKFYTFLKDMKWGKYKDMQDEYAFLTELSGLFAKALTTTRSIHHPSFNKYCYKIKNDKQYFDIALIDAKDMRTIQCVLPKQNNPRLIAQQGAFLLFGFKDAASNKTATPIVPDAMYGKYQIITKYENGQIIEKQQSSQKAKIIIKGSEKQKILDELKILGISNSTMFPEIDNIANELKNQYAKLR